MDCKELDKSLKTINSMYNGFERRVKKERAIETFYEASLSEEDGAPDESKFKSDNNLLSRYNKLTRKAKIVEILIIPIILAFFGSLVSGSILYVGETCFNLITDYQELVVSGQAQFDEVLQRADPSLSSYSDMKETADSTMEELKQGGPVVITVSGLAIFFMIGLGCAAIYLLIQIYSLTLGNHDHDGFEIAQLEKYLERCKQRYLETHPGTEQPPT